MTKRWEVTAIQRPAYGAEQRTIPSSTATHASCWSSHMASTARWRSRPGRGASDTDSGKNVLLPSVRLDPLADPHRPSAPALFSELDAVALSLARLLPEPLDPQNLADRLA